jgi:predicted transcriptional regulator
MKLFEIMLDVAITQSKKINRENAPSRLIFEIFNMRSSTKSKIFTQSAVWISPEITNSLVEQGLVQKISSEEGEKYALTFAGIAQCIRKKYGKTFDVQFTDFLALVDQKFNAVEQTTLNWDEKLAILSLTLLASSSESSAIRLNNETNKKILGEVFQRTLTCLKNYGLIDKKEELRTVSRGESPASALMSRLDNIARKTNHYYKFIGKGSQYYLDIEDNEIIDERRLNFLLKKVFGQFDANCNYDQMQKELQEISQSYYPRFLARSLNPNILYNISRLLRDFMQTEILHLPMKIDQTRKK